MLSEIEVEGEEDAPFLVGFFEDRPVRQLEATCILAPIPSDHNRPAAPDVIAAYYLLNTALCLLSSVALQLCGSDLCPLPTAVCLLPTEALRLCGSVALPTDL